MSNTGEARDGAGQIAAHFGIETEWVSPEALTINKNTAADGSGGQNAFIGYADDGKGIYQSNFPKGTPKLAKAKKILKYIQNVWSKEPIPLRVVENGETRVIYAEFDPTYDETENTPTDASKLMGGNRHGNSSDQRVTLDLADDYYQIASESTYNYSKDEEGKSTLTHDDVSRWHYFINDIYFAEYGSDSYAPYRVTVNVKEKPNGHFVYSFSAEKIRESNTPQTLHAVVNERENSNANVQLSNTTVSQNSVGVNSQFMQDGAEYAQGRYIPATYTVNEQGERVMKTPARILLNAAYADGNWQKLLNFVIKHELTHSIEGTSAWEAMVRTVQRSMGKDAWNAAVEQVRAERQAVGDAAGVANPEAEVIANWVGDNLYKTDFIHTMVQSNTRAAGRLVGILDRVRLALGGEGKNPTAGQIAALERTFLKALESGETRGSRGGDGQYSLDTGVYNEENSREENLIYAEPRQETREAFLRRADEEALTVKQRGEVAYAFRRTRHSICKTQPRQVEEELKRLGVPCAIIDRLEVNKNGTTKKSVAEATTARGDAVYINNLVSTGAKEVAGHEAFHFWGGDKTRDVFEEVLLYNIDFSSAEFYEFVSEIEAVYFDEEIEVGGKNQEKLTEEICAYISGFIHSGNNLDLIQPFLRDYNEVKSAWEELVKQHSTNNVDESSSSVSNDIETGFSDARNSILSPERMAEFEGAAQGTDTVPEYEYADEEAAVAVEKVRQQKLTQRQQEQKAALAALTERYRAGQLLNIENQSVGLVGSQQNATSPIALQTGSVRSVADLVALVKQKDPSYTPKPVNQSTEQEMVDQLADGIAKDYTHGRLFSEKLSHIPRLPHILSMKRRRTAHARCLHTDREEMRYGGKQVHPRRWVQRGSLHRRRSCIRQLLRQGLY